MSFDRFIGKINDGLAILEEEEFHHAVKVKRIKEGDIIEVNDLHGNIYTAKVTKIERKKVLAELLEKLPVEEELPKITLYQCMPNHLSKMDDIIGALNELGVYKLVPVISKYTAVKEKDILKKIKKWEKISINSIKQCKRPFPLNIEKPVKLKDINPQEQEKIVFYEKEREKTLKSKPFKDINTVAVLIGAEGGLAEEEVKLLQEKGYETYTLGKNILRMETAIITGICQVKFVFSQ